MPQTQLQHLIQAETTLVLVVILIATVFLTHFMSSFKHVRKYIPESTAAIVLGVIVGAVFRLLNFFNLKNEFTFSPEIFYFLLLPPIIYEAGFSMKKGHFFSNMGTISLFVIFGTFISALVIGFGIYFFVYIGAITSMNSDVVESLQFGALISATDPVATLSIMGAPEMNIDPTIYSLVFGEAVLNDAISIVLFRTLDGFIGRNVAFTYVDGFKVIGQFFGVGLGSILIGLVIGLINALLLKKIHLKAEAHMELSVVFLFSYSSYVVAEISGLSGILSIFVCSVVTKHYSWYSLSQEIKTTTVYLSKTLGFISETFVFVYLGINTVSYSPDLKWDPALVAIACFITFFSRAFNIFPLSFVANLGRKKKKISFKMQIMLWFAGLRGAVAFALALNFRGSSRNVIVTTTLAVVLFTTFVLGSLTAPLVRFLKLQKTETEAESTVPLLLVDEKEEQANEDENDPHDDSVVVRLTPPKKLSYFHNKWVMLDEKFLKPLFGGNPRHGYSIE